MAFREGVRRRVQRAVADTRKALVDFTEQATEAILQINLRRQAEKRAYDAVPEHKLARWYREGKESGKRLDFIGPDGQWTMGTVITETAIDGQVTLRYYPPTAQQATPANELFHSVSLTDLIAWQDPHLKHRLMHPDAPSSEFEDEPEEDQAAK